MPSDLSEIQFFREDLETREEFTLTPEQYDRAREDPQKLDLLLRRRRIEQILRVRELTSWAIIVLYVLSVLLTWALVFAVAFDQAAVPESFLQWLGGAILAELAPGFILLMRTVWGTRNGHEDEAPPTEEELN